MVWTAPRTYVTSEVVTAAILNLDVRDNLNAIAAVGIDGWTDYSGSAAWTMSTSGTITDTVDYAQYCQVGKLVVYNARHTVISISSPVGNCEFSLPVTASYAALPIATGTGWILDANVSDVWSAVCIRDTTTSMSLRFTSATNSGFFAATAPIGTLGASDAVSYTVMYEA